MTHFRARMCYFKVWKLIFIILTPSLPTNRHLTILMTNLTEREVYLRNRFTVVRFNSKLSIILVVALMIIYSDLKDWGNQFPSQPPIINSRDAALANYAIKRARPISQLQFIQYRSHMLCWCKFWFRGWSRDQRSKLHKSKTADGCHVEDWFFDYRRTVRLSLMRNV